MNYVKSKQKTFNKNTSKSKGKTSETSKLDGAEIGTTIMLMQGISVNRIAKLYGVHRNTVKLFIKRKHLDSARNINKVVNYTHFSRGTFPNDQFY
ncbi:MAG: hypothetical protein J6B81_01060 [Spirochaetaceae bacterium]|nr:hypothetical protein [Spirochaetaceae bacterium]